MGRWVILYLMIATALSAGAAYGESGLREINGTQLFCTSEGDGPALVVLHGGPGVSHDYLRPHLDALTNGRRVIYYDQRGSGRSSGDVDPSTLDIDTFVADLEDLRRSYGLRRMDLLGHSWGGLLALHYALAHPERVRSLVLVDSAPANSELDERNMAARAERLTAADRAAMQEITSSEAFAAREPAALTAYLRISEKVKFHDPARLDDLRLDLDGETLGKLMNVSRAFHGALADYDIHDRIAAIDRPTLILHGAQDTIPLEAAERIHHAIAGSELVTFERCGHFPFIEAREAFLATVAEFLERSGG